SDVKPSRSPVSEILLPSHGFGAQTRSRSPNECYHLEVRLWSKAEKLALSISRPLYRRKRTSRGRFAKSVSCHKQTHARSKQPLYSMTSSARASSEVGMSSPSALAVLRLITSSNLVGC